MPSLETITLRDEKRNMAFQFPVNPSEITIQDGRGYMEVPIINLGTTLLAGPMAPQEISFASFLPKYHDYSYCNYTKIENPLDSWDRLIFWMGRTTSNIQQVATPLRVVIAGSRFSQLMVITDLQRQQVGGEPGDIYFSISIRQWRSQRVRIEDVSLGSGEEPRPAPPKSGVTYTVKKGDTLWAIAKTYYNDGSKWPTIYNANKGVIGSNPNLIKPGQVLVIP